MIEQQTTRVNVGTEEEFYPLLSIYQVDVNNRYDKGRFDLPVELWRNLEDRQRQVDEAEKVIMSYLAANYPDARDVVSWCEENE